MIVDLILYDVNRIAILYDINKIAILYSIKYKLSHFNNIQANKSLIQKNRASLGSLDLCGY